MDRIRRFGRPGNNEVGSWGWAGRWQKKCVGYAAEEMRLEDGGVCIAPRWVEWLVLGLEDGEEDCGSQVELGRTFQVGTAVGRLP